MRTSKAYYEKFKAEFLRWQKELGLTQYRIDFFHEKTDSCFASIVVGEQEKIARVSLGIELNKDAVQADPGPEAHAKHEVLHLLTNRLRWLGSSRFIETTDLEEEWEAIVVRLDKVLK